MNERIKELYNQALESKFDYGAGAGVKPGEYYSNYITVLNPEKFAELIVRECAKALDDKLANPNGASMAYCDGSDLLEHFGVEE